MLIELCFKNIYGRLQRWLTLNWVYVVMALTFLLQTIDWEMMREALQDQSPSTLVWATMSCAGGLAVLTSTMLRAVLFGPHMAWLLRQPISPIRWSVALFPWLFITSFPLLILPLLGAAAHPLLQAAMWMLVWAPVAISAAGRSLMAFLVTLLVGMGLMAGGVMLAPVALVWALVTTGPLYVWLARRTARWTMPTISLRPSGPIHAAISRDLLCLIRTEPRTLLWGVLPVIPAAILMEGMVRKQTFNEAGLHDSAAWLFALAASGCGLAMAALSERLGRHLTPRRWPISTLGRAVALSLVAALTASPAFAAISVTATPSAVPMLLTQWMAISVGGALIAYRRRLDRPPNLGNFSLWLCLASTFAMLIWPTNILLTLVGLFWLSARIRWFNTD